MTVVIGFLLHDELLGDGTGSDEVHTAGEVADVDRVDTLHTLHVEHILAHDVEDADFSVVLQSHVQLADCRIGIDFHLSVGGDDIFFNVQAFEVRVNERGPDEVVGGSTLRGVVANVKARSIIGLITEPELEVGGVLRSEGSDE